MIGLIFTILMIYVFFKIAWFAIKLSWGIVKVVFGLIFLPLILIGLFLGGLAVIAIPVLVIIGIISLIASPMVV